MELFLMMCVNMCVGVHVWKCLCTCVNVCMVCTGVSEGMNVYECVWQRQSRSMYALARAVQAAVLLG